MSGSPLPASPPPASLGRVPAAVARRVALAVAAGRVALGVVAVLAPGVPLVPWVGPDAAGDPSARLLARALGGRDVALGLGALLAWRRGRPMRGWVEAAVLADAVDTAATLGAFGRLPRPGRLVVLAAAGGAAAAGAACAPTVDLAPG